MTALYSSLNPFLKTAASSFTQIAYSPLKLCSKLYSKPYTELQSSTNTQH